MNQKAFWLDIEGGTAEAGKPITTESIVSLDLGITIKTKYKHSKEFFDSPRKLSDFIKLIENIEDEPVSDHSKTCTFGKGVPRDSK